MTQLGLFDKPEVKRSARSEKRIRKHHRRLFWTGMKHTKVEPQRLATMTIEAIMVRTNYRLALRIPGYYTLAHLSPDYWDWMHERRNRLWKLVKGYEAKGNTDKADFYYRLYCDHTYHL